MSEKPHSAGAPATEITPEMIEAGAEVLWSSGAVEHPLMDNDRELIRQIFLAMIAERRVECCSE